jgi:catechol 2,3-dioxygenase-like lactoylglutathione lyase family enzyme
MLDHVGFGVSGYERSKAFYEQTLRVLGITLLIEPAGKAAGFGRQEKPFFWIEERPPAVRGGLHIAFAVDRRELVHAFHTAGLEAGGTDNGAPGLRTIYHPHYYGAYVLDPDGNNIEAVCHEPA